MKAIDAKNKGIPSDFHNLYISGIEGNEKQRLNLPSIYNDRSNSSSGDSTRLQECKSSFLSNLKELIGLVESGKFFTVSWAIIIDRDFLP